MKFKKSLLLSIVLLSISSPSLALIVGSNAVVSRNVFFTFPDSDSDNEIRGFAFMAGGFALANSSTTCIFNALFPSNGPLDLNGGTLVLNRDLILNNDAVITSLGGIDGNGHVFRLAPSTSLIPTITATGCVFFSDLILELSCDVTLQDCCITFTGNSILNGRGYSLTLNPTSTLQVGESSNLFMQDITIKGLQSSLIKGLTNTSTFSFKDAELVLSSDYTFGVGSFAVLGDLRISGTNRSFIYQTDQVSTISGCGALIVDYGVTFSYAPSIASRTLLQLVGNNSAIALLGGTLYASAVGLRLGVGQLLVDGRSFMVNDGTSVATGITFDTDLFVNFSPAATLELIRGIHEM